MKEWNRTILCVDDEESILESYREILGKSSKQSDELYSLNEGLKELYDEISSGEPKDTQEVALEISQDYNLLFARTGEEAIALAHKEKEKGREIAIGFFDMRLEGKMDGLNVIKEIKSFMPHILCSIVTAYTDRTREQIGVLFEHQDEWVYFNKPFTRGELLQTACNLVASWNLRRSNEEYLKNLSRLVNCTAHVEKFDLLNIQKLEKNILEELLLFIEQKNGLLLKIDSQGAQKPEIILTEGAVDKQKKIITSHTELIHKAITDNVIIEKENSIIMPVFCSKQQYAVITPAFDIEDKQKDLIMLLLKNAGGVLSKAFLTREAIESEKEKAEAAVKALKKISSTLCHHINNPLAVIKGFAEIVARELTNQETKNNIITIEKSCDVIHSIVDILTNLNKEEVEKTIDTDIGIQLIDIEKQVEQVKRKVEEKYKRKD